MTPQHMITMVMSAARGKRRRRGRDSCRVAVLYSGHHRGSVTHRQAERQAQRRHRRPGERAELLDWPPGAGLMADGRWLGSSGEGSAGRLCAGQGSVEWAAGACWHHRILQSFIFI